MKNKHTKRPSGWSGRQAREQRKRVVNTLRRKNAPTQKKEKLLASCVYTKLVVARAGAPGELLPR